MRVSVLRYSAIVAGPVLRLARIEVAGFGIREWELSGTFVEQVTWLKI